MDPHMHMAKAIELARAEGINALFDRLVLNNDGKRGELQVCE